MIRLRIDEKLKQMKKTRYWLAKETGIPQRTLYRYCEILGRDKHDHLVYKTKAVKLNHIGRLHQVLKADPGELFEVKEDGTTSLAIKTLLDERKKSLLWLAEAQDTDIVAIWKLATNQRTGIYLETLEKLYRTLGCRRSELIEIIDVKQNGNGNSRCA